MLTATVEFLHGTFRADPDGTAHTGRLPHGEWPPAPSRLFDALVAADGTGERCRHTDGSELGVLETAPCPSIEASVQAHHQQLNDRFVVLQRGGSVTKQQQEYVARTAALVRPGVRVSPRVSTVLYRWPIEIDDGKLRALQVRAARIGYLGCADSPVRVRIERLSDTAASGAEVFEPDEAGDVAIGVPAPGRVQMLDAAFAAWTEHGTSVGRSQYPALATKTTYRSPSVKEGTAAHGRVVAALILRPAVSGRRVAAVAATFKAAVLRRFQDHHGEEPPGVLHGHGFEKTGYHLARYLSLPDVGHAHARGRIHAVALWLPPECDETIGTAVREAVHSIRRLGGQGVDVSAEAWDGQRRPLAARPGRWTRPSRRWVTVFPAIHERHVPLTLDEIGRWCRHAGLPQPVSFRSSRSPLLKGSASLAPTEVHRPGKPRRPYSHVELQFDEPVAGPVVIGSGRQRGFGLCLPVGDRSTLPTPSKERG
ncbi:MAG: type I-U CRISPR-associated protein Cas5/Cas6 [Acidimicrobiales bacterium]|nr:type I-U CRISPR-associated protein Cas5/Cas6 [Acidimicrobiales bacterium]MYB80039.1 type I-U CRISPR-associated protein Cas5/Cas6 [Acidimicrobiales bacterium]MYI12410.1 type I-U CRISPR-associated protein Cas5/Cas6 [Acidimicrobiales bacterium]